MNEMTLQRTQSVCLKGTIMKKFKFGIMGAGYISGKFCDAAGMLDHCEVAAVSSKSMERAKEFAAKNGIRSTYDSYEEMLLQEELDGVYIGVTPDAHYELSLLCLNYKVPVLCEKAMFLNSAQAREVFGLSRKERVFIMEAMWSRFLPANQKAKGWIEDGKIGNTTYGEIGIGFMAPQGENRYFNPKLGGGAARDITVYAYELMTFMISKPVRAMNAAAVWGETEVDVSNHVTLQYDDMLASLKTTFVAPMEERMVIYGEQGKLIVPFPHFASEAFLYDGQGNLREHFKDNKTKNGFVYEIEEVIQCVLDKKIESSVVPHETTIQCAQMFDAILATKNTIRR